MNVGWSSGGGVSLGCGIDRGGSRGSIDWGSSGGSVDWAGGLVDSGASVGLTSDEFMELSIAQSAVSVLVVGVLEVSQGTVTDWSTLLVVHGSEFFESDRTRSISVVSVEETSEVGVAVSAEATDPCGVPRSWIACGGV